eukprot:12917538-Prorocentrum_lima.AAC.1
MAVTAKNTLTTVVQATQGYQPGFLPDIDQGNAHCDDAMYDGISRRTHRLQCRRCVTQKNSCNNFV